MWLFVIVNKWWLLNVQERKNRKLEPGPCLKGAWLAPKTFKKGKWLGFPWFFSV
jgi:hypothetical protein